MRSNGELGQCNLLSPSLPPCFQSSIFTVGALMKLIPHAIGLSLHPLLSYTQWRAITNFFKIFPPALLPQCLIKQKLFPTSVTLHFYSLPGMPWSKSLGSLVLRDINKYCAKVIQCDCICEQLGRLGSPESNRVKWCLLHRIAQCSG